MLRLPKRFVEDIVFHIAEVARKILATTHDATTTVGIYEA